MGIGRTLTCAAAAAALLVLPACGKRFPFGERLLPESYGPPFGSALKANVPEHPHNPASEERHAASDAEENRTYPSHAACNAAMRAAFARHASGHHGGGHHQAPASSHGADHGSGHQPAPASTSHGGQEHGAGHRESHGAGHGAEHAENPHGPVAISSIESVGHYTSGDTIHEYRCTNYTLSYRAWHPEGAGHNGGGHSQEH